MKTIQVCFLQHDWLYASLDIIPAASLDGKDSPKPVYVMVNELITECPAEVHLHYKSQAEAIIMSFIGGD